MKERVVLLGPPASGKGTQAALIEATYGIPVASPGAMLREELKAGSPLGAEAEALTSKGRLLPDEIIVGLVEQWLDRSGERFVLDGFPRTLAQAGALDSLLKKRGRSLDVVVGLQADDATLRSRVADRVMCSACGAIFSVGLHAKSIGEACPRCGGQLTKRRDDTPETLVERLAEYRQKTFPLVSYYQEAGLLQLVDSTSSPELVFSQVRAILEAE